MLAELLVLSALKEQDNTVYGLRKTINAHFGLFCSSSLSVVHRALKNLSTKGRVKVKNSMSKGGQKSSTYSILQGGREYFIELMTTDFPLTPSLAHQLANVRILLLETLDKPTKKKAVKVIKDYYRVVLADFVGFIGDNASERLNREYIKHERDMIKEKIAFLGFMELD